MDCLFCKIIAGDIPSTKVYEDETVLAEGTKADLVDYQGYYSFIYEGIGLAEFGQSATISGIFLDEILDVSIAQLAEMAQEAWADNASWKAYADAVVEFHNVYNNDAENTMTPDAVATAPEAEKGELGEKITSASATVLMSDAAGIRLTVELSEIPTDAKFVIGDHEVAAVVTENGITADIFFAHEALADVFQISVQDAEGQVYMTYTASIENLTAQLAGDEANESKNNATAFLVYIQKAVACK